MNETPIPRHRFMGWVILMATGLLLTACDKHETGHGTPPASHRELDPDWEPDGIPAEQLSTRLGTLRKPSKSYRLGGIVQYLGLPYWQLLADGMSSKAVEMGVTLDIQSSVNPFESQSQLEAMRVMVARGYDAILISPQSNLNLMPVVLEARRKGILVVVVAEFAPVGAEQFVGPRQYDAGVHAARFFMEQSPAGGDVALIRGLEGPYHAKQRSQGFIDTLKDTKFKLVADEYGRWELQKSLEIGASILTRHPKVTGFYCFSDVMALGVAQAVKDAGATDTIIVGTNGIRQAVDSISAGGMSATVDLFPVLTGRIAVEVTLRLLDGQKVPRVVYSPQALITRKSLLAVPAK